MLNIVILPGPDWFKSMEFSDELFVNEKLSRQKQLEAIKEWLYARPRAEKREELVLRNRDGDERRQASAPQMD